MTLEQIQLQIKSKVNDPANFLLHLFKYIEQMQQEILELSEEGGCQYCKFLSQYVDLKIYIHKLHKKLRNDYFDGYYGYGLVPQHGELRTRELTQILTDNLGVARSNMFLIRNKMGKCTCGRYPKSKRAPLRNVSW